MVAILKMAAILKLSKATKIVKDNFSLQSGHKFTTNNEVSEQLAYLVGMLNRMNMVFTICSFTISPGVTVLIPLRQPNL
jgi:hypothetical protein